MDIIAHRGFTKYYRENTMKAFKHAEKYSDLIELDVRVTKDNTPVVFHDIHLKKFDINKYIKDIADSELKKLNNEFNLQIPFLESVIDEINAPLLIDLKDKNALNKTIELVEDYENKVIIQSFQPNIVTDIPKKYLPMLIFATKEEKNKNPHIPESAMIDINQGIKFCKENNISHINIPIDFVNNVNSSDLTVYVYFLDEVDLSKIPDNVKGVIVNHYELNTETNK